MWLRPLEQWYCDTCGDIVEVKKGYVLWERKENKGYTGFRIIHQARCDSHALLHSLPLSNFVGDDGRALLLSWLTPGPLIRAEGDTSPSDVADLDEFVDFFRRVQTPYYEQARRHFNSPTVRDNYAGSNEVAPYLIRSLKAIIEAAEGPEPKPAP